MARSGEVRSVPSPEPTGPKPVRARPSGLRAAQKELTRSTLVDSARAAFEEKGYVDVTIDDIVGRAGASRATFYLYFPSKLAVFLAVMELLNVESDEHIAIFERDPDISVEGLYRFLQKSLDFYWEHRLLVRALQQAQIVEPELAGWVERGVDRWVSLWERLDLIPDAGDEDLRIAATLYFVIWERMAYLMVVQGIEVDRDKTLRAMAEMWHQAFQVGRRSKGRRRR